MASMDSANLGPTSQYRYSSRTLYLKAWSCVLVAPEELVDGHVDEGGVAAALAEQVPALRLAESGPHGVEAGPQRHWIVED